MTRYVKLGRLYPGIFSARYFYLSFCIACFIIALLVGLFITQSGPGISPDSVHYIRAGENIYSGNGFTSYLGGAPLYPLSIAAFMHVGFDAEQAARLVPILCFALLMFPLFFLGKTIVNSYTGYTVCLLCLVLTPLLWVASYVWTEMPYILFSVTAILFLTIYAESKAAKTRLLCASGLFSALAILTRYIGVTLLLVGLIVIVINNRANLKRLVYQALLFGATSCILMVPWLYRNIALTSHPAGYHFQRSSLTIFEVTNEYIFIIINDFFPDPFSQKILSHLHSNGYIFLAIILACFILLALYIAIHRAGRREIAQYIQNNYPGILYIFVYLISIITIRSIWYTSLYNRYVIPVYPLLIVTAISLIFYFCRQIKKPSLKPLLFSLTTIVLILFFLMQTNYAVSFGMGAKDGQGYNSPAWRNCQALAWATTNIPDDATIYTDSPEAVSYRLNRAVNRIPDSEDETAIVGFIEKLASEKNSFIIRYKEGWDIPYRLTNYQIAELNQKYDVLDVAADLPRAIIWQVSR